MYGNFVGMCRPYFYGYENYFCVLFSWVWNIYVGIIFMGVEFFVLDICLSHC